MGKTRNCKTNRGGRRRSRKTRRRGGGIFSSVVTVRNIGYIDDLEKRLVNKWNDYDWVQEKRGASWRMKKDKKDYK